MNARWVVARRPTWVGWWLLSLMCVAGSQGQVSIGNPAILDDGFGEDITDSIPDGYQVAWVSVDVFNQFSYAVSVTWSVAIDGTTVATATQTANGNTINTFIKPVSPGLILTAGEHTIVAIVGDTIVPRSFTVIGEGPEMDVQGNSVSIADGDSTPSLADHTDFGAVAVGGTVVRTYTIRNTGTETLNLTGNPRVVVSGTHASDFTVTTQPAASVAAGGTSSFQVTFVPGAAGTRTAGLSIGNNDANENPYDYMIRGSGEQVLAIQGFVRDGTIVFTEAARATGYQVESGTGGDWTSVTSTPATGSGMATATVSMAGASMLYRVVATVTNPPVPPGMVLIPAGSFMMGDSFSEGYSRELPVHGVSVSAFYMDATEVTKAQWDEVATWAASHGYDITASGGSGKAAAHPVQTVTWYECVKWCNARSEKEGLTPAYYTSAARTTVYRTGSVNVQNDWVRWEAGYRLPTEAEWEKAARGGAVGQRFPWGAEIQHSRANYESSSSYSYDTSITRGYHPDYDDGEMPYTSPVGSFAPNGYGLYDMAGNVYEWCWDWYSSGYYGESPGSDPRGAASGSSRVFRGGGWDRPRRLLPGCRPRLRQPGRQPQPHGLPGCVAPRSAVSSSRQEPGRLFAPCPAARGRPEGEAERTPGTV